MVQEELNATQEKAAICAGNAKQYEALARSSDEALKSMQACLSSAILIAKICSMQNNFQND